MRAQLAESLSQRIAIARDIALHQIGHLIHETRIDVYLSSWVTGSAPAGIGGIGVSLPFREDCGSPWRKW